MICRNVWFKVLFVVGLLYGLSGLDRAPKSPDADSLGPTLANAESANPPEKAPKIEFSQEGHDFGDIAQNSKVSHTFKFQNRGDAELIIEKVRASCGCTAALASDKNIPAGSEGSIDVTFDSTGKKGPFRKTISVTSNDPARPEVRLTVSGTILTVLNVEPAFLSFGNRLKKGEPAEQRIRLWRTDKKPFKLVEAKSDWPFLQIEVKPDSEAGRNGYEITARISGDAKPGRHNGSITVATDIPKARQHTVRFFAQILGDLRVQPKFAVLGTVTPGTEVRRKLRVSNQNSETPFKITSIQSPLPFISAEISPIEEGKLYELEIVLSPKAPEGTIRGNIVLKTDLKSEPTLNVPIYGFVGKPPQGPPAR